MSVFLIVCVSLAVAVVACFATLIFVVSDSYKWDWIGWLGLWLLGALAVCGLIAVVIYPSRAVGRTTCRHWGTQTGYRTKFVILNWVATGTCLTQLPDGRWVPNTHVIINSPERR